MTWWEWVLAVTGAWWWLAVAVAAVWHAARRYRLLPRHVEVIRFRG